MKNPLWDGVREGCGTCEFWHRPESLELGECRRRPPAMLAVRQANNGGNPYDLVERHWPWMAQQEWCGEYKRAGTRDPSPDPS